MDSADVGRLGLDEKTARTLNRLLEDWSLSPEERARIQKRRDRIKRLKEIDSGWNALVSSFIDIRRELQKNGDTPQQMPAGERVDISAQHARRLTAWAIDFVQRLEHLASEKNRNGDGADRLSRSLGGFARALESEFEAIREHDPGDCIRCEAGFGCGDFEFEDFMGKCPKANSVEGPPLSGPYRFLGGFRTLFRAWAAKSKVSARYELVVFENPSVFANATDKGEVLFEVSQATSWGEYSLLIDRYWIVKFKSVLSAGICLGHGSWSQVISKIPRVNTRAQCQTATVLSEKRGPTTTVPEVQKVSSKAEALSMAINVLEAKGYTKRALLLGLFHDRDSVPCEEIAIKCHGNARKSKNTVYQNVKRTQKDLEQMQAKISLAWKDDTVHLTCD